jgi:hypothetical protein
MDEAKTKLVLEAETRGFDKVQQVVEDVVGVVDGSGTKPGALASLDRTLASITTSLGKLDEAVKSISKTADGMKRGGAGNGGQGTGQQRVDPNFLRGVLQGLGVGQYLPGATTGALASQATGAMIGRGVRGVGGGIISSGFNGIGSLISGAASLPGGGLVAGPMQTAVGAVEQALALEQAQQGAAFALDLAGGSRAARRAGASAAARARELADPLASAASIAAAITGSMEPDPTGLLQLQGLQTRTGGVADSLAAGGPAAESVASSRNEERQDTIQSAASRAASAARFRALYGMSGGDFAGLGVRYGMDQTELTRFASEVARARGGTIGAMGEGGGTQAALAASVLGIDAGTSGRVLRGATIGAMPGAGSEGDALARTIGRAMALGLEGSEIAEDIARTAQGIEQFERTGLPIADESRTDIARALVTGTGMAAPVAAGRAAAFSSSVQSRAMQGLPTDALGFAELVKLGGYQGGGSDEAIDALFNMQRKGASADGLMDLARTFAGVMPGSEKQRAFSIQQGFTRRGMSLGADEAIAFERTLRGEELPPAEAARRDQALERMAHANKIVTAADIDGLASQGVGGGSQRQAGIRNTAIGAGMTAMSSVQDFEARAMKMAATFSQVIKKLEILNPGLDKMAGVVDNIVNAAMGYQSRSGGN